MYLERSINRNCELYPENKLGPRLGWHVPTIHDKLFSARAAQKHNTWKWQNVFTPHKCQKLASRQLFLHFCPTINQYILTIFWISIQDRWQFHEWETLPNTLYPISLTWTYLGDQPQIYSLWEVEERRMTEMLNKSAIYCINGGS